MQNLRNLPLLTKQESCKGNTHIEHPEYQFVFFKECLQEFEDRINVIREVMDESNEMLKEVMEILDEKIGVKEVVGDDDRVEDRILEDLDQREDVDMK